MPPIQSPVTSYWPTPVVSLGPNLLLSCSLQDCFVLIHFLWPSSCPFPCPLLFCPFFKHQQSSILVHTYLVPHPRDPDSEDLGWGWEPLRKLSFWKSSIADSDTKPRLRTPFLPQSPFYLVILPRWSPSLPGFQLAPRSWLLYWAADLCCLSSTKHLKIQ